MLIRFAFNLKNSGFLDNFQIIFGIMGLEKSVKC